MLSGDRHKLLVRASETSLATPTLGGMKLDESDGLQSSRPTCILKVSGRLAACYPRDARVRPLIYLASGSVHVHAVGVGFLGLRAAMSLNSSLVAS